jgi:hypothetical protein
MEILSVVVQITAVPTAGPPACSAIVGHGGLRRSKTDKGSAGTAREVEGDCAYIADLASGGKISWNTNAEGSQWLSRVLQEALLKSFRTSWRV